MMTDPVADLLTRIRNALRAEHPTVDAPDSTLKRAIVGALQREGYVWEHEIIEGKPFNTLRIHLKYGPNGEQVIQKLKRVSVPGRRVYSSVDQIPNVLQGLGISILSTNQGVLSGREARMKGIGGELLCQVW